MAGLHLHLFIYLLIHQEYTKCLFNKSKAMSLVLGRQQQTSKELKIEQGRIIKKYKPWISVTSALIV